MTAPLMAIIGLTDFSKLAFTITRKDGGKVTVQGNRCGGDSSQAVVVLRGRRLFRSVMPDAELAAQAEARAAVVTQCLGTWKVDVQ